MSRKSDELIVPRKPANKTSEVVAELVEEGVQPRATANTAPPAGLSAGFRDVPLAGCTSTAKRNKKQTFNNLFSLIDEELLVTSFKPTQRQSAAGCDGVTWQAYEQTLPSNIQALLLSLKLGRYRPKPARRVFIPKEDGSQRPLSIICLEDKIVQQAVVTILNQIYEMDFLGFPMAFGLGEGNMMHLMRYQLLLNATR